MNKLFPHFLVSLTLMVFFIFGPGRNIPVSTHGETCQLYFVDKQLHALVPTVFSPEESAEKTADKIVKEILSGRDKNTAILRMIPNIKNGITVNIKEETAYVNLSSELTESINKNAENEKLVIYQIVNSLTSIDGINYVRFTIDGRVQKVFLGFLDMREIFVPDYDI